MMALPSTKHFCQFFKLIQIHLIGSFQIGKGVQGDIKGIIYQYNISVCTVFILKKLKLNLSSVIGEKELNQVFPKFNVNI